MPLSFNEEVAMGGRTLHVFDYDTYNQYRDLLQYDANIGIKRTDPDGKEYILPVRGSIQSNMDEPGVYLGAQIDFFSRPTTPEEKKEYYPKKDQIFDFGDTKSMQELLDKSDKLNDIKNQILESPDNLTQAPLKPDDKPAMRGLKLAINSKEIDLDKYKDRFGINFPNNKRKLADTDITLFQLNRYCECLDMEMDIVFRDAKGDIANPMNKVITVNVYPGNSDYTTIQDVTPEKPKKESKTDSKDEG